MKDVGDGASLFGTHLFHNGVDNDDDIEDDDKDGIYEHSFQGY